MARVTVWHLTRLRRLPLIEEQGLRTRADLSDRLGPPGVEDRQAPGTYAHGRRVSAYLSLDHARTHIGEHGRGLITFTVDPAKVIATPGAARDGGAAAYWDAARQLRDWLTQAEPPVDLEVHQNVPVRAKYLRLPGTLLTADELGPYAEIVEAVADTDRLSAKALMHLAIIASDGDDGSHEFATAVALAYRDGPEPQGLVRELVQLGPDKVASAALAEYGSVAPDAAQRLRQTLEATRGWAEQQGLEHGQGLLARSAAVVDEVTAIE
ncbi:MAG: hypothetical protein KY462_14480 [Actinobacteria bacterium]|nr:hypothetical protein [Actinomycetota bacterium]